MNNPMSLFVSSVTFAEKMVRPENIALLFFDTGKRSLTSFLIAGGHTLDITWRVRSSCLWILRAGGRAAEYITLVRIIPIPCPRIVWMALHPMNENDARSTSANARNQYILPQFTLR